MRRALFSVFVCGLFAALTVQTAAADRAVANGLTAAPEEESLAECVLIVDRDSGQALYEHNTGHRIFPASTTKMMTALCAVEAVDDLDATVVTVRQEVLDQVPSGSSRAGLREGEEFTVRQLLYAMMLPSGGDAALALADFVSGSESAFVDRMNQRAAALGCEDTFFVNCHGLTGQEQYSTAWDLARIAEAYLQNPDLAQIAAAASVTFSTNERDEVTFKNSNLLLDETSELYLPGVCGVKTGIISEGAIFISALERDGLRLLCVAAEVPSRDESGHLIRPNPALKEGRMLLDWAGGAFTRVTLCERGEEVSVSVPGDAVPAAVGETVTAVIPREQADRLVRVVTPAEGASRLGRGAVAGQLAWYCGDTLLFDGVPVYAQTDPTGFPLWLWAAVWTLLALSVLLAAVAAVLRRRTRHPARGRHTGPEEDFPDDWHEK